MDANEEKKDRAIIAAYRMKSEPKIIPREVRYNHTVRRVSESGLEHLVGVVNPGDWCFTVHREIWQNVVISVFVLAAAQRGNRPFTNRRIARWAADVGFLDSDLLDLGEESVAVVKSEYPDFVVPSDVIEEYLRHLADHGLLAKADEGWKAQPANLWK